MTDDAEPTTTSADTIHSHEAPSPSLPSNWIETNLRLPPWRDASKGENTLLCLPDTSQCSDDDSDTADYRLMQLDHYLATLPPLVSTTQMLLFNNNDMSNNVDPSQRSPPQHRLISSSNSGRVINIIQGEIAHCTPSQAEILVSDDATTCHIVAMWSRRVLSKSKEGASTVDLCKSKEGASTVDLCSRIATMAHIDGPGYGQCIRDAVGEHIKYHSSGMGIGIHSHHTNVDKREVIEMSINIMGGFNDHDGSSSEITNDILQTFAAVSKDYECDSLRSGLPHLLVTLQTCAVASANDDGTECPLGRGLAMEVATGKVFLAEVDNDESDEVVVDKLPMTVANDCISSARGPAFTLRSIRLWASAFHSRDQKQKLHIIHQPNNDYLIIEPFFFAPHYALKRLLNCNDKELLQQTSTSPEVEKSNFSSRVRESFMYMNQNYSSKVFPMGKPIKYYRVGLNGWVRSD